MSWPVAVLISLTWFLAGFHIGWFRSHITIVNSCSRLGGFYVGCRVFKCTAIDIGAQPQLPPARNPVSPSGGE